MSKQITAGNPVCNFDPAEFAGADALAELALNLHWSWNHSTDEVWRKLDSGILWQK